jgi:hypothetical protein
MSPLRCLWEKGKGEAMAPLVCDTLDETLTSFKEGLGRKSSGEPGGEMSAEQSARLASR